MTSEPIWTEEHLEREYDRLQVKPIEREEHHMIMGRVRKWTWEDGAVRRWQELPEPNHWVEVH